MAVMKIKTPTKSWEIKDSVKNNAAIENEIKYKVASVVLPKLAITAQRSIDRQISIMATFFQRLVARTPIDESYEVTYVDKKGNEKKRKHTIDRSVCQDSWYITDGKVKVTAAQMKAVDKNIFWNVNERYSVDEVKKILKEKFVITDKTEFVIGNDNDHYDRLEKGYSKWFNDGISAKKSVGGLRRDHGVKNMHSIQAPVGMWRITYSELELIKESTAISPLTSRYRSQYGRIMNGVPNRAKLAEFARFLESKGNIAYKDIVRYLENY